jgi:hypothetical protein
MPELVSGDFPRVFLSQTRRAGAIRKLLRPDYVESDYIESVAAGVARGAVAIDLVDVVGHAFDFAHGVVHRLTRAIGLD